MPRTPLSLTVGDVSAFARSLGRQIAALERSPGHVELLNMIARAGGFRNFQHLSARRDTPADGPPRPSPVAPQEAPDAAAAPWTPAPAGMPAEGAAQVDRNRVRKLLRSFGQDGRLLRWPGKRSLQLLALWAAWSRIPSGRTLSEPEVNAALTAFHDFGDHALLRRELFDLGLLTRSRDGREYRRAERRPPAEALELLAELSRRT